MYSDTRMVQLTAPYVPGYLAFREAEPLVELINSQLENKPELTPQVTWVGLQFEVPGLVFFASKVAFSWPSVDRISKKMWGLIALGQVESVPNFC